MRSQLLSARNEFGGGALRLLQGLPERSEGVLSNWGSGLRRGR